jgi:hypothetical protein
MKILLIGLLALVSTTAFAVDVKLTSSIKIVEQLDGVGSVNKPYILTDSNGQKHELICGSLQELRIAAPNFFATNMVI